MMMTDTESSTKRFSANREHFRSAAYRMLGPRAEADETAQEAFLPLARAGATEVDNITGWP